MTEGKPDLDLDALDEMADHVAVKGALLRKLTAAARDRDALRRRAEDAESRNARQARELTYLNEVLTDKNRSLDALHYVWCDGGCASGLHRFGEHPPMTEEIMQAARINLKRLERWWINHLYRAAARAALRGAQK